MQGIELVGAGIIVLVTVAVGMIVHELTHAAVLHSLGVPYDLDWFPESDASGGLGAGLLTAWATVTPRRVPGDVPPWGLQLSAIAPLALALPFALVFAGVLPDPVSNNVFVTAATVAWLGCALPSPQDFSLFWHATAVVNEYAELSPEGRN